jgi:hypothetical protein
MIEDYLKKLETIISPQTYDLNNYKEKILQSNKDFPDREFIQGLDILSEDEQSDIRSLKNDKSQTKTKGDNASVKNITKSDLIDNKSQNVASSVVDEKSRAKIHNLNVKNMAYRQQIDSLNRKIEDQARVIESQRRTIEENKVTIENNSRYLLKLESYLVEAGKNKARERFTLNLLGVNTNFANECKDQASKATFSVERENMKEMIVALINENQKLKDFQNKIINLSQTYDEINSTMVDSLRGVQENLTEIYKSSNLEKSSEFYLNEISQNVQRILFSVEETLTSKQNEFKLILDTKDEELEFLRKEIVELNGKLENAKKDRMKDQKNMIEIECQNNHLHQEIEELNKTIHENYTKLKLLDTENISSKIEVFFIFYLTFIFYKETN